MELINLKRVLSDEVIDLVQRDISKYADGNKFKVFLGQVHIGGSIDNGYEMLNAIIAIVTKHYKSNISIVLSKTRKEPYITYRQIIHYLARKYTNLGLTHIGNIAGKSDHSTVIHSIKTISQNLKTDTSLINQIDIIEQKILIVQDNEND